MIKNLLEKLRKRAYRAFTFPTFEETNFVKGRDEQLSANFWLREFVKSDTAIRHGIDNWPPNQEYVDRIKLLTKKVLQPVRDKFGSVKVNSGFRTPEVNKLIGGAKNSQHMSGYAADIEVLGISNKTIAEFIYKNLDFDQLILEYWYEEEPNSGWIHVSYKSPDENRKEVLTINKNGIFRGFRSQ